jgi:acetyl esterase/lipase
MIGTNPALGNLRVWCGAARWLAPLLAVALGGCADLFFATVGGVGSAQGVNATKGIEFDAAHHLSLDVYAPDHAALAPVVVFFYGGSWEDGKRRWYRYVGDALASNGVVTIIPDYRKYPDVRFPAFMHDAANAVAWARDHAREFGGDPQRLFVMGHSAGGQIAALLAADGRYLGLAGMRPRDLSGMIGVAGAYAFLPFVDNEEKIFGNDATGRYDSQPINFISGDEPPMLLLQGDDDDEVPLHNAQIMAERAEAMDGTAGLKIYPGVGHSSIMLSFARGHASQVPALRDTLVFIAHPPTSRKSAVGEEAPLPPRR